MVSLDVEPGTQKTSETDRKQEPKVCLHSKGKNIHFAEERPVCQSSFVFLFSGSTVPETINTLVTAPETSPVTTITHAFAFGPYEYYTDE